MDALQSNPLLVALLSGVGLALLGAIGRLALTRWRLYQQFSFYWDALAYLRDHGQLTADEYGLVSSSLSDQKIRNDIVTVAVGAEDEAKSMAGFVSSHAAPENRLHDPDVVLPLVYLWLEQENYIEGQHSAFHARALLRHEQLAVAKRKAATAAPPDPSPAEQAGAKADTIMLVTPFTPFASIQGKAKQCRSRDAILHMLHTNFESATNGIVVIEGFGGMGKTVLASKLAADLASESDVLWVDCQTQVVTTGKILAGLAARAANQYHYQWLGDIVSNSDLSIEEKISGLVDFFAARPEGPASAPSHVRHAPAFTLIFDDYHDVRDRGLDHLISRLATSNISVKIVLLLRNRHDLSHELQMLIDSGDTVHLSGFTLDECAEFLRFYGKRYPALADVSAATVQRVWRRTGEGIPQALTILVDLARRLPLDELLRDLPSYDMMDREIHKTWFDKLFYELSGSEQEALTSISVLRKPAPLALLEALCDGQSSERTIEELVDRFVLVFDGRLYSLHALWADYARKLLTPEQAARAHQAAATFLRAADSAGSFAYVMDRLESCYHYLQADLPDDASAVLAPIADRLLAWGYFQELNELVNELEKRLASRGATVDADLQIARSGALLRLGDPTSSINLLKTLIEQTTGAVQIRAIHNLGWIYLFTGENDAASELFVRSLKLCRERQLPNLEVDALHGLSQAAYLTAKYDESLTWSQQRVALLRSIGEEEGTSQDMAQAFHDIGNVYREQGKFREALPLYERNLEFWRHHGDPLFPTGWLRYDIGQICYQLGEWNEAQSWYEKALDAFDKVRFVDGIGHAKIELGRNGVHATLSKEEAITCALDGVEDEKRVNDTGGIAYGYQALADIHLFAHEPDQALAYLEQSMKLEGGVLHSPKGRARTLHGMALAHEQQAELTLESQRLDEARALAEQAQRELQTTQSLYASIGVVPEYRHIDQDAQRIARLVARCSMARDQQSPG